MKYARLIFANLLRKKARLILTIGSFAVALFLFTFLAVVKDAFGRGTELAGADRLVVINRVGLIQTLPLAYRDKILAIPGVKDVTHNHWFGGVYQDEKNFFPQFAIDVEHHRQVMTEFRVPDDQWNAFVKDQQGAIAGAALAKRFGRKVGDRIPLQNALYGATKTWQFNLDGIYHNDKPGGDESQYWFQWKYFDENVPQVVKSTAGWYVVKLESPDDAANVGKAVDTLFANSSSETKTETESAFQAGFAKQLGNIQSLILTIGGVVFFTLLRSPATPWPFPFASVPVNWLFSKPLVFRTNPCFLCVGRGPVIALIGGVLAGSGDSRYSLQGRSPEWIASGARSCPSRSCRWAWFSLAGRGGEWFGAGYRSDAAAGRGRPKEGLKWRFRSSTIFAACVLAGPRPSWQSSESLERWACSSPCCRWPADSRIRWCLPARKTTPSSCALARRPS